MKRLKHVGDAHFVANRWARQDREYSHTKSQNLSFRGLALTSYATQIGNIYTNGSGDKLAIIDDTRFSSTTNTHQHLAKAACGSAKLQYVAINLGRYRRSSFPEPGEATIVRMVELAADLMDEGRKRRGEYYKNWHDERAIATVAAMKVVAEFFKLPCPGMEAVVAKANEFHEKQLDYKAERRDMFKAWREGGDKWPPSDAPKMLRLKNGDIQTSDADTIELDVARRIVSQWMYDKGFRQPWSFMERSQRRRRVFGRDIVKYSVEIGVPDRGDVQALFDVGPEKCIQFFLKNNLFNVDDNGVESPALVEAQQ